MRRAPSIVSSGKAIPTEPSYFRALREIGLIPKTCSFAEAFRLWTVVARDRTVLAYEKKIRDKQPNTFNNSRNLLTHKAVLQLAESVAELAELKKRIENRGASSPK